jgi:hypothetical protein
MAENERYIVSVKIFFLLLQSFWAKKMNRTTPPEPG